MNRRLLPLSVTIALFIGMAAFGGLRYDGCTVSEPTPETKEPRMDLNFTCVYTLAMSDLEAINGLH